jgi:murein DD-endopeptidase MepM/ murein hydrolase activator NlpD
MVRSAAAAGRAAALLAVLVAGARFAADGRNAGDVAGPVTYRSDGVSVGDRKTLWRELKSLDDQAPDLAPLRTEFAARAAKRADTPVEHLRLAAWARDHELAEEARAEFEAVLRFDADQATARRALGFVRAGKEWRRTKDVVAERRGALAPVAKGANGARVALAQFAAENGDPDDEWDLLVEIAAADPWDAGMITRVKSIVARRPPGTPLRPPLTGTWRAEPDPRRHHQLKVFAIEAIDFRKVDAKGGTHQGTGQRLEDYYGYDAVITAAADGVVNAVEDQFPDLPPGQAGKFDEANYVSIDHDHGECSDYGHVRRGSALVHVGDRVRAGQPIARVGNSGASGFPHLHFTLSIWATAASGAGAWISVPWRFHGFRVVAVDATPCDFEAKCARVPEGWTLSLPEAK